MFNPIKYEKASQKILLQIIENTNNGILKKGMKLPSERELVKQFNVSRTSLREALRALEIIGVIRSRVGDGNYISDSIPENLFGSVQEMIILLEEAEPSELLEAREMLECKIVRLAAAKATKEDCDAIEAILASMNEGIEKGQDGLEKDGNYHMALAKGTHNCVVEKMMEKVLYLMNNKLWAGIRNMILDDRQKVDQYYQDHLNIYEAIKDKDPDRADELMLKHLKTVRQDVERL